MSLPPGELRRLAHRMEAEGPAAVQAELEELARVAAAAGVASVLLAVVCDEREPDVARQRAFARVAGALESRRPVAPCTGADGPDSPPMYPEQLDVAAWGR